MININTTLTPATLQPPIDTLFHHSAQKIQSIEKTWDPANGAPVFTINGTYTSQGWTDWTQGFQYGSAILQYDATGDTHFLHLGRTKTTQIMAPHITHFGVHDHGFNNISTYGNLLRLMNEQKIPHNQPEQDFYELAIKCSGAVQAHRWTPIHGGQLGYIHSFNGPHSLFADTIRSLRALSLSHTLGHYLLGENDTRISLLQRMITHARATAQYSVYYGENRDTYDTPGRVVHEAIFNTTDGKFRCPSSQQGYSPFTTWTRGQAWIICGYPEQLEYLQTLTDEELQPHGGRHDIEETMLRAAIATADHYIRETPTDGIPYWDTGAPGLIHLGDYQNQPAQVHNDHEPVDSSAAAIACQGLLRLGRYLTTRNHPDATKYTQAGLTVLARLLQQPYLSTDPNHQGLLLHSIYHRPNGWDHIPPGSKIPLGESCMWGDYHLREAALYVQRLHKNETYYTFFGPERS